MTEEDDLRPDQRERITRGIISRDDKPLKPRYYPRNPAMQSVIMYLEADGRARGRRERKSCKLSTRGAK